MSPPVKPGPFCFATLIAFSSGKSAATTVPAPRTGVPRSLLEYAGK